MNAIKKVWITEYDGDLVSLSFESERVEPEYMRLKFESRVFPDKPTKKSPLRHTGNVKLLSLVDLKMIENAIGEYLDKFRE
jgi:hypothetical protein